MYRNDSSSFCYLQISLYREKAITVVGVVRPRPGTMNPFVLRSPCDKKHNSFNVRQHINSRKHYPKTRHMDVSEGGEVPWYDTLMIREEESQIDVPMISHVWTTTKSLLFNCQ